MTGQRRHALEEAFNLADAFAHGVGAAAVEQQPLTGELHAQGGQGLVDLVGEGGRHLPQRGHPRGMHQFILRGVQLAGALFYQTLQLVAAAAFHAAGLAPLGQVQQQERERHPDAGRGQAVAADVGGYQLRLLQQVQGPVFLGQFQTLPEVVAAAIGPVDQAPLAVLVDLLQVLARQRLQILFGVAADRDEAVAHRLAQRAQVAEAPGWAVGQDDDVQ